MYIDGLGGPVKKLVACVKRNKGFYTMKYFGGYKAKVKVIWRGHDVSTSGANTYWSYLQIQRKDGEQDVKQSW